MKHMFLLPAFLFLSHTILFSQGCLPEGITFTTQEQIDNFQANYPGCTRIEGDVEIFDENTGNITNLSGLNALSSIEGCLEIILNPALIDLGGLENLTSVGEYVVIYNNDNLICLVGLENLDTIGGHFDIFSNSSLVSLYGLESLNSIGHHLCIEDNESLINISELENITVIEDYLRIKDNPLLASLNGLENLSMINGSLVIENNMALTSLSGLVNLIYLNGTLKITNNDALIGLSGLEGLTSVGGSLLLQNNDALLTLAGLENLTTICGDLLLEINFDLTSLSDLHHLTSIGNNLKIFNNTVLTSLSGLGNINAGSIMDLNISYNDVLSNCDVQSICEYLSANGTIWVYDNAPGCNSELEIEAACLTGVEDNITNEVFALFPNPATSFIAINLKEGIAIEEVIIYNHLGQKVLVAKPVNNTIDVSKLKPGIYFLEVITSESRIRTKIVIE